MDGSEKITPLVIGKSAKPRCFKGINSFPPKYRLNKKAWMTTELFNEWPEVIKSVLDNLENQQNVTTISILTALIMIDKVWRAVTLLIIYSCFKKSGFISPNLVDVDDRLTEFNAELFLCDARCHQIPSECTRSTCSLNQWVRSLVGLFTSAGTGEYFPPLQFTCRNCGGGDIGRVAIYRPFGEVSLSLNRTVTCMVLKANDRRTSCPCHDEFPLPEQDLTFNDYVLVETDIAVLGALSDTEIVALDHDNTESDEDESEESTPVTLSKAKVSLSKLHNFFLQNHVDAGILQASFVLEKSIDKDRLNALKKR
ncbi:tigger transposable element-derived protein 6 [Trichonephila clavipes]|nr:tigger transposable element-derived protein 6 [Trichonephila clavipes]